MKLFQGIRENKFLGISSLVIGCLILTGCGSSRSGNHIALDEYLPGLFSEAELLRANDFAVLDPKESFTLLFDGTGFKAGDSDKKDRLNWGKVQTYLPDQCKYEYFWSGAPLEVTKSKKIKGFAVNFRSINMSIEDFMLSKASVLGEYILVFESEELASSYYSAIADSLKVCTNGVRAKNVDGSLVEVGLKNAPNKNFRFYQSSNTLVRSSQDGLIGLDVFAKTRYSIIFYKVFVNDQNLPNKSSWSALNSLLNDPINRICILEKCEAPVIDLANIPSYEPSGQVSTKPKF